MSNKEIELIQLSVYRYVILENGIRIADINIDEPDILLNFKGNTFGGFLTVQDALDYVRSDVAKNNKIKLPYDGNYCHLSNKDCENCPLNKSYGLKIDWQKCPISPVVDFYRLNFPNLLPTKQSLALRSDNSFHYSNNSAVKQGSIRKSTHFYPLRNIGNCYWAGLEGYS